MNATENNRESVSPNSEPEAESEVCLQCHAAVRSGTHFCPGCGAPLDSYAWTAPFESAFAEGYFLRRAVGQPRNMIVVTGVMVIVGLTILSGAVTAYVGWRSGSAPGILAGIGQLGLGTVLIAKTVVNYVRRWRRVSTGELG